MEKRLLIALGTASKKKKNYVTKVFDEIGFSYELIPIKAKSLVSDQPITEKETLEGSINRAKDALSQHKDAEIGLGIEVGYGLNPDGKYEIFSYASIVDSNGLELSCSSHKFLLPKLYQDILKENDMVHKHLHRYYEIDSHPSTQYLARLLNDRELFIVDSVRQVILRYLRREDF